MIADKVKELEKENISLKAQVEELQNICGGKANMPKNCEYCNNFIQHYIRSGNSYAPTHYGCCVAGNRIKTRQTDETCKSFVKKSYGKNYL